MAEQNEIQLFDGKQVRYVWDEEQEKYFFSGDDPVMVALKCLFFSLIQKRKKGKTHFGITSSLRSHPFCIAVLSIAGYK